MAKAFVSLEVVEKTRQLYEGLESYLTYFVHSLESDLAAVESEADYRIEKLESCLARLKEVEAKGREKLARLSQKLSSLREALRNTPPTITDEDGNTQSNPAYEALQREIMRVEQVIREVERVMSDIQKEVSSCEADINDLQSVISWVNYMNTTEVPKVYFVRNQTQNGKNCVEETKKHVQAYVDQSI